MTMEYANHKARAQAEGQPVSSSTSDPMQIFQAFTQRYPAAVGYLEELAAKLQHHADQSAQLDRMKAESTVPANKSPVDSHVLDLLDVDEDWLVSIGGLNKGSYVVVFNGWLTFRPGKYAWEAYSERTPHAHHLVDVSKRYEVYNLLNALNIATKRARIPIRSRGQE